MNNVTIALAEITSSGFSIVPFLCPRVTGTNLMFQKMGWKAPWIFNTGLCDFCV